MKATPINEVRRVETQPRILLPKNPNRASFNVINQHPTIPVWVAYGTRGNSLSTAAGAREGIYLGPNGGQLFDDMSTAEIYAVSNAINNRVMVIESITALKVKQQ